MPLFTRIRAFIPLLALSTLCSMFGPQLGAAHAVAPPGCNAGTMRYSSTRIEDARDPKAAWLTIKVNYRNLDCDSDYEADYLVIKDIYVSSYTVATITHTHTLLWTGATQNYDTSPLKWVNGTDHQCDGACTVRAEYHPDVVLPHRNTTAVMVSISGANRMGSGLSLLEHRIVPEKLFSSSLVVSTGCTVCQFLT